MDILSIPLVYMNGHLLPQTEAQLPLHDAGFVMGATATDLCRTFGHRLFRLDSHLRRFRQSCFLARVPQPLADEELIRLAEELVRHNAALLSPEQDLALVLLATPGPVGYYLGQAGGPGDGPRTLILHTFPLPFARYARLVRDGTRLIVPSVRHVPAASIDPRIKQRSRLHWWLAEQEVHQIDPLASALLLDDQGRITETAAANFLLVRRGEVLSPPCSSVLGGVSLHVTQELCQKLGIPFHEQVLTVEDCLHADEAWLTSTPYCLAGVRQINGVELPWPGHLLGRLLEAWNALAGFDVHRQILSNP